MIGKRSLRKKLAASNPQTQLAVRAGLSTCESPCGELAKTGRSDMEPSWSFERNLKKFQIANKMRRRSMFVKNI